MTVKRAIGLQNFAKIIALIRRAFIELFHAQNRIKLLKWLGAGLALVAVNTFLLYLFVERLGLLVINATFIAAEISTLLRFLINHYWVFGRISPRLADCAQFHIANAGAFLIWWSLTNLLIHLGMHYLAAGIVAVACSTLVSLATNFFWIWRKRI